MTGTGAPPLRPGRLSPPEPRSVPRARQPRPPETSPPAPPGPWIDDPYDLAVHAGRGPLFLRSLTDAAAGDERLLPLDVEGWCAPPDRGDRSVLHRCEGPVLDIGCGPGRLVAALTGRGVPALGIDVSPAAVARTRLLGGAAVRRSVFERLPGEGRWPTALLMDGNVGIAGDPVALLARTRRLTAPGGLLLAEALAQDVDERLLVRIEDANGRHGPPFAWARLGAAALLGAARAAGWTAADRWTLGTRCFLALRNTPHAGPGTVAGGRLPG
ncbi:class I SAM-dependent methyltransferase [Streptomyces sp. NPDC001046]|uniref:class I SAM-dependent methyltransferase n=1 Tax=Streptomyces sp. NPDC001046 TaxID=3364543 RepID=UPI0036B68F36